MKLKPAVLPAMPETIAMRVFASVVLLLAMGVRAEKPAHAKSQPAAPKEATLPYQDPHLTIAERVADLLPRLTLEEKVQQISGGGEMQLDVVDATGTFTKESARTEMMQSQDPEHPFPVKRSAILRNAFQRYQLEKSRLGIPALFMGEGLHGFMENGSTSFPQVIGMASTFDPALVHQVFTAVGDEAGSRGADQVFTPVLDIARDPRWGRTEETYGEDPFLVSRMGVAAITGLQGDSFMIGRHHVLATAKHFAVHGQPEGGTNTAPANYSERIIRENFLVPFQAAVEEAHVGSVMASYNEIDGIPSHINHWLLGRVLRQEWGFPGYITSDGDGIQMLWQTHHVAADNADAARQAISAGIDYDLSDGSAFKTLLWQVKQGIVPMSDVDRAVSKVLAAKFRLGLFEDPYVDPDYAERVVNGPDHRALAEKVAEKVVVLLKNDKNLLPLDLSKTKTIAVIGPDANDVHLGGYSREPGHGVSIVQGIREYVGSKANVIYAQGCAITTGKEGWRGWYENDVTLADPAAQGMKIQEAVAAAQKSDVAILVVGENESTNREAWAENHLGDRDSLDLLGAQNDLVKAIVETGKPVVVMLINGRPLSINYISEHVPAIIEAWYLGQEGGTAAARVLFGDVNPGGKLPITFPHTVGDLPDFYNHKPSANRTYAFSTRKPLYPFGYGLSYTSFRFANLKVEPTQIEPGGTAQVTVDVTNTGSREGDEVPQLYVHQELASVTRPVMQLRGFQRITLGPGERRRVEFTVGPEDLSMLNIDMHKVVERGVFDIMVGPSSAETTTALLQVGSDKAEKPPMPPAPAGSESGVVSTFDEGKVSSNYGMWINASDSMNGGKSSATIAIVSPGAENSKGALQVSGEVVGGGQFPFGGVLFIPGSSYSDPANLSSKKEISFWAKGDGQSYTLVFLTLKRSGNSGEPPAMTPFVAGPDWKQYSFPFSTFQTDGSDVTGVGFVKAMSAGKFNFELDQVEIK